MTKLMHSLPWTLALTLAAQAGEPEQDVSIPTEQATFQESADPTTHTEYLLNDAPSNSDLTAEEAEPERP